MKKSKSPDEFIQACFLCAGKSLLEFELESLLLIRDLKLCADHKLKVSQEIAKFEELQRENEEEL